MTLSILLQAAGGGFDYQTIAMMAALFAVFYFFMIRPQQKKQKDAKKFQEALQPGDRVIAAGGIHGKVMKIEDDSVTIDIDRGTKITVEKYAVNYEASKKLQDAPAKISA